MDSLIHNVATEFGLKCSKISRARFGHSCATTHGLVLVQKFPKPHLEHILFSHEVKEYLFANNFGTIDRNFTSKETGAPFVTAGGEVYVACLAYDAPNADFSNSHEFLKIVSQLATFHKTLAGAQFAHTPNAQAKPTDASEIATQMQTLKKKIMKAGKFSDFDMLFLTAYEKFEGNIVQSGLFNDKIGHNNHICHNLLKEENVYMASQPIFTNFARVAPGHFNDDLVYITKRYLKANPSGNLSLNQILNAYSKNHEINDFNSETFAQLLQFPDKFVKLSKDYYSKKRNFAPKAYITRMQECLYRGEAIYNWLN